MEPVSLIEFLLERSKMKKIARILWRWITCKCQKCGRPTIMKYSIYAGLCIECDDVELYKRG